MARSVWKGPFVDGSLLKTFGKVTKAAEKNVFIKFETWSRRSIVLPQFIDKTIHVYNGRKMLPLKVSEGMVGYKLGEFIPTRNRAAHKVKAKDKKKR
jgi:small subunit ribosomal protein S19